MPHLTRKSHSRQTPGNLNPTTKASSFRHFERWYKPVLDQNDNYAREFDDPKWEELKKGDGFRFVWTIVDSDSGTYLLPGFHFVNRMNWVLTEVPWQDDENKRGGYVW